MNIKKEIIEEIIEYIETVEVAWDAECGSYRSLKRLIDDYAMPSLYYRLKEILDL